mmetsp:Transcript_21351/g.37203  ORF Transcript_21351/g.37203 Transcript_21351/m.37203 type:complete len:262 (-) Transcript_21351:8-793(-)
MLNDLRRFIDNVVSSLGPFDHLITGYFISVVEIHVLEDLVGHFHEKQRSQWLSLRRRHRLDKGFQVLLQLRFCQLAVSIPVECVKDCMDTLLLVSFEEYCEPASPFSDAQITISVKIHGIEDVIELITVPRAMRCTRCHQQRYSLIYECSSRQSREHAAHLVFEKSHTNFYRYSLQRRSFAELCFLCKVCFDHRPSRPRFYFIHVDHHSGTLLHADDVIGATEGQHVTQRGLLVAHGQCNGPRLDLLEEECTGLLPLLKKA